MRQSSSTFTKTANPEGEKFCTKNAISTVAFENCMKVLRAAWPKKTASYVAHLTGTNERAVQFWLAGNTRMSMDAVVALLRTDAGYDILESVMGDCKAEWWLVTQTAQDVRKMRKEIQKQEDRIAHRRAQLDLIDQLKK